MRVVIFIVVLLAIIGVFVADGANMYGAHRKAVNFANEAAEQATQTYVDTGGSQDAVHRVVQEMAADDGVELVDLSYHRGTTQWYEVTVKAQPISYVLNHIPFIKGRLVQESTAVAHF